MSSARSVVYSFTFSHHGRYSSYHRLLHYSRKHITVDSSLFLPRWLPQRLVHAFRLRWQRLSEWRLRGFFRAPTPRCLHYLYPENSLFRGARWKGAHKLVLSCHQPAAHLAVIGATLPPGFRSALQEADCIVLLSAASLDYYRKQSPRARIEVIPHGVDTEFFRPDPTVPKRPLVLTVGNWLRDYACWAEVVRRVASQRPEIEFAVVANPSTLDEARSQLGHTPARVSFLTGLSDEALRDLYRQTTIAFVPLKEAEANNAVLESLAMGLPLVATDLPAVREYAGTTAAYVKRNDAAEFTRILLSLLGDPERRGAMGAGARAIAENRLSWPHVAAAFDLLYRELLADPAPAAHKV